MSGSSKKSLSTSDIRGALADGIEVPESCICAYIRELPYRLTVRTPNPNCTVHSPDEPGEIEKERD